MKGLTILILFLIGWLLLPFSAGEAETPKDASANTRGMSSQSSASQASARNSSTRESFEKGDWFEKGNPKARVSKALNEFKEVLMNIPFLEREKALRDTALSKFNRIIDELLAAGCLAKDPYLRSGKAQEQSATHDK